MAQCRKGLTRLLFVALGGEHAEDASDDVGLGGRQQVNRAVATAPLREGKQLPHFDVEGLGQLGERGDGGTAFAAQDLGQVALREVGLEVEAVERSVLALDELLEPPPEQPLEVHREGGNRIALTSRSEVRTFRRPWRRGYAPPLPACSLDIRC